MTLIATIGGLITLLFWGAGDYFTGKSGQRGNVYLTNLIVQIVGLLIFSPITFFLGVFIPSIETLLLIVLMASMFTVAFVSFVKALALGPFGIASPISNSYALVTLIAGIFFLGFNISQNTLFVLLLIITGVGMLALDRSTFRWSQFHGSTVYFAGLTAILWGIGFALADIVLRELTWYQFLFFLNVFTTVFGFLYYKKAIGSFPDWREFRYRYAPEAWLAGILLSIGSSALFFASQYSGSVVIPAVIASAAPLVTSLFARLRDNEQLSGYKRLGALIVVIGLMLLNVL